MLSAAEQERANAAPLQLLGVSEIAALLQVSRQRVDQLRARPDFPTPAAHLKAGLVGPAFRLPPTPRLDETRAAISRPEELHMMAGLSSC